MVEEKSRGRSKARVALEAVKGERTVSELADFQGAAHFDTISSGFSRFPAMADPPNIRTKLSQLVDHFQGANPTSPSLIFFRHCLMHACQGSIVVTISGKI
jgi:hypothetical protein